MFRGNIILSILIILPISILSQVCSIKAAFRVEDIACTRYAVYQRSKTDSPHRVAMIEGYLVAEVILYKNEIGFDNIVDQITLKHFFEEDPMIPRNEDFSHHIYGCPSGLRLSPQLFHQDSIKSKQTSEDEKALETTMTVKKMYFLSGEYQDFKIQELVTFNNIPCTLESLEEMKMFVNIYEVISSGKPVLEVEVTLDRGSYILENAFRPKDFINHPDSDSDSDSDDSDTESVNVFDYKIRI